MSAMVDCVGVSKQFDEIIALQDASFAVGEGEFCTLLGPSGCGKTTMLRMIAGFEMPDSGDIHIAGKSCLDEPAHRRGLAMVFQGYALFPHRTVLANVMFGLRMHRRGNRAAIAGQAREALAMVGLSGLEDRYPRQLSGGQQQRVALARAIVLRPKVLLLDEPLSALDLKLRKAMRYELKRLQTLIGITTIYVTHDQEEAMSLSDRIVVMNHDRVEQIGSPTEVYGRPTSPFVAEFIGESNLIDATLLAIGAGGARLRLEGLGTEITVDPNMLPDGGATGLGQAVSLVLRAEKVSVSPDADTSTQSIAALVVQRSFLGAQTRLYLKLDGIDKPLMADLGDEAAFAIPGANVRISWTAHDVVFVARS
ncbi:MAG: ABC transporter ATP-binding protein [Proteobacteria bacterium]|nr:ABC transporter ATP-binding protein [Pseudomonadota bacterium]